MFVDFLTQSSDGGASARFLREDVHHELRVEEGVLRVADHALVIQVKFKLISTYADEATQSITVNSSSDFSRP